MANKDRFDEDLLAAESFLSEEKEGSSFDKGQFAQVETAAMNFELKQKGRRKLLMDMYGWKLLGSSGVKRREVARRASREIQNPEDRRWLASQVMETSKEMGWEKRRDMTKKGFLRRFGEKLYELPQAAAEGAIGIGEDYAGMGRGIAGQSNEQRDIQFTDLLEAAYNYGDPKQQNEDNLAFKAIRGTARLLPQVGTGAAAFRTGGVKLLGAQAGLQMFAPIRERLVSEGVGPVKATAISALTAGLAGAVETAIPIPGAGRGGIPAAGKEVAGLAAKKLGLGRAGKETAESVGRFGTEFLGEAGEEFVQGGLEATGSLAGAAAENKLDGREISEVPREALSALKEAALPLLPLSLGGGALHVAGQVQQRKARKQIRKMAESNKAPSRRQWKELGLPPEHGEKASDRLSAMKEINETWTAIESEQQQEPEQPEPEEVVTEEDVDLEVKLNAVKAAEDIVETQVEQAEQAEVEALVEEEENPEPEQVSEEAGKLPWQMTKREFGEKFFLRGVRHGMPEGGTAEWAWKWAGGASQAHSKNAKDRLKIFRAEDIPLARADASEFTDRFTKGVTPVAEIPGGQDPHLAIIKKALAEGEKVPAIVLEGYPDLQREVADFLSEETGALKIGEEVPQGKVAGLEEADAKEAMKSPNEEYVRRTKAKLNVTEAKKTRWQRIVEAVKRAGRETVRRREHIPTGKKYDVQREILRQLENVKDYATGEALGYVRSVVQSLSDIQFRLFDEYTRAKGQLRSLNMENREFLRYGVKSQAEVEQRIAQLAPLVEATPEVKQALAKRGKYVVPLVKRLVDGGILGEEALEDPESYLHQQVIVEGKLQEIADREGKSSISKKKSFMKPRVKDLGALKIKAMRWVEENPETAAELAKARSFNKRRFPNVPIPERADLRQKWLSNVRESVKMSEEDLSESIRELEEKGPASLGEKYDPVTGFIEQEVIWLGDAIGKLREKELWETSVKEYDRFQEFDSMAREDAENGASVEEVARENGYEITNTRRIFGRAKLPVSQVMDQYERQMAETMDLTEDEVDLAHGEMSQKIALPKEIMDQIREDEQNDKENWMGRVSREMMNSWKAYTLMNPMRFVAYNARNFLGDLDVSLAGDPGVLLYIGRAIKDLKTIGVKPTEDLSKGMRASRKWAVVGSGRYGQEMKNYGEAEGLGRFRKAKKKTKAELARAAIGGYWNSARGATQFREDLLRHAAFLRYRKLLQTGQLEHFGGAKKEAVLSIQRTFGTDAAAAHMARSLLGDYGDLTVMGNRFRSHLMPFWAFTEINAKRYPRILQNAFKSGKGRTATGAVLAKIAAVRIGYLYGLQWMWNNVMAAAIYGGDPEEDLSDFDKTMGHLITGYNADGTVRVFRNVGALSELLESFGINEAIEMLPKLKNRQADLSDVAKEIAKAPVEKVLGALGPHIQALPGVIGGLSMWPNFLEQWRTVDRTWAAANIGGLGDLHDAMKGKIVGQGYRARKHWLQAWFFGVSDPRVNMRNKIVGLRHDYLESEGRGVSGVFPISKYKNARKAAENDDKEAFLEWQKSFREGKTPEKSLNGFMSFLKNLDPIDQSLNDEDEWRFTYEYLDDEQREELKSARDYSWELRKTLWNWWSEGLASKKKAE